MATDDAILSHPTDDREQELSEEIRAALNRASRENASNTPDFILAQYLLGCLAAFERAVQQRETWYGRDPRPTLDGPDPLHPAGRCICGGEGRCAWCRRYETGEGRRG